MRLSDVTVPGTEAAERARWVVTTFASPALAQHSQRSYLWAAAYGEAHGIAYDAEDLYVSAMLHDIGLVPSFDSHTVPFEPRAAMSPGSSRRGRAGRSIAASAQPR